jgi:hypothetical protein
MILHIAFGTRHIECTGDIEYLQSCEQPPPKGGGFRFRLEAGLIDPSGR